MSTTITLSPLTRVEGHLDVELTLDEVGGSQQVVEAKVAGPMFRGFEKILYGRDPRDATHYTQRICGVCPVSHGMASCLALEDAFGVAPAPDGRIIRNLVLGANFIQSHILHFYHLVALDYIDTTGILELSPWTPRYTAPDMVTGTAAEDLVANYIEALAARRKAHQMGAIFSGKLPMATNMVPGGSSEKIVAQQITDFRDLLTDLRDFIDNVYVPDVQAVASLFPAYGQLGVGSGNLLAYGVFRIDDAGMLLMDRGRYDGAAGLVDEALIREYVAHSWYTPDSGDLSPADGVTEPEVSKPDAYSFIKAPRYDGTVYEVGPLARMVVSGLYPAQVSVIDRIAARALETQYIADVMDGWLDELVPDQPVYVHADTPTAAFGIGLTEAPRGALGHWVGIAGGVLDHYQVISPTTWNASPTDDFGQNGAMEQALLGLPVADAAQPVEVLRVVHSFDPCLACSVHMVRPSGDPRRFVI